MQLLLYAWVLCFLSYALWRTNRHSAWWWNLGLIRFQTTRKLELMLVRITSGNPLPDSNMSCMLLPPPYMGLFLVPTESLYNVEPLSAYSFGLYIQSNPIIKYLITHININSQYNLVIYILKKAIISTLITYIWHCKGEATKWHFEYYRLNVKAKELGLVLCHQIDGTIAGENLCCNTWGIHSFPQYKLPNARDLHRVNI